MKICIVGAGAAGLSAAYRLSANGFDATVIEKEDKPGGLARAIPIGSTQLDRFYHHIFTNDIQITALIEELGLSELLRWAAPTNGIYVEGRLRPFTSPLDLLLFHVMPLAARISTGLLVLKARKVKNWKDFENTNARDWLIQNAGMASYEKLWGPLLKSKFGNDADKVSAVWIWNKFKLRGSSRGKNNGSEMLGYLHGSFSKIYDTLVEKTKSAGGKINFEEEILQILPVEEGGYLVNTTKRSEKFDLVLFTAAPNILAQLTPTLAADYKGTLSNIRYKADVCMILELSTSLSPYYWITVAEKDSPFVLVIEHTNLFPDNGYGSHIIYLSRYLDVKDELYQASDEVIKEKFFNALGEMFPNWDKSTVKGCHITRARDAQPVVTLGYSGIIPAAETPLKGLYLASMAQIYPEDRGQNYAIRSGLEIADMIIKKQGSAPSQ